MEAPDLSIRQAADAALRERAAALARVQRIGQVGGFEIDLRRGLSANYRSPEYLRIHGLPPEAVDETHEDWVRRLHPDDRARAEAHIKQYVESGARDYASEYRIVVPGKGVRWISAIGEIEHDEAGTPIRMSGVHIDITRTKNAELALRSSEVRLREVLEAIGEAFYALDSDGRFTNVSRRALEMWGLAAPKLLGHRFIDVFPYAAEDVAFQAVLECKRSGRHIRTEAPATSPYGRWVEQDAYPTSDGGVAVAFRDIHDRKQTELALRESEHRLRDLNASLERLAEERARQLASSRAQLQAFFDNSPDWLSLQRCTPEGRFIYVDINPGCEAAYGKTRDEVVGRTVEEILGEEAAQLPISHFQECLRTGQPQRYVTHRTLAGVTRTIDVIFSLVPGESEDGDRFIITSARDLTDRERLETQLRQAQKMEAIGQLTGGVAHDFNNLLAVIIGNATMIRRRSAGDPKLVDNILVASERGVALTRQLLSLSRHKAQTRQVVDLRLEMPRIIEMLRPSLRGDIELRFAIASKLPHIDIDLGEFEIALLNLAVNARDAMPAGGEFVVDVTNQQPHDTSKLLEDRACVVISIQDTGVGMPKEVLERASEPFFTTKKLGSGTGLGLSQVRSFVEASEGRLTIDSAVESGTTVTLYLPDTDKARQSPQVGDTVDQETCLSGCVLLVDDNRDVANTTAAMLDAMGLEVEIADRAVAALEQLSIAPNRFRLLITDVVMPGMNGIDLAREVRVRLPHLPIILMSGYNDATETSGDEFKLLRKPVSFDVLYVAIRESSS